MAPDRPSSPTSLLWAHQIRREHQYLLSRMKKLESASEIHSDRIKSAETAAKAFATGEVASLTAKISALETSGKTQQQHVIKLEKDLNERLDDTQAETEALALQVASLVDRDAEAKEETKLVLQGIEEAKAGLKKYENSLKALDKIVVPREIRRVEERLEMLSREIGGQAGDLKVCREDVQRLGEVNEVLRKGCETLEGQVRRVAERGPMVGEVKEERATKKRRISAVQDQPTQIEIRSGCEEEPTEPKKKTHKYTGGGADKDIIQQGAMLSLGTRSAAKATSSVSTSSTIPVAPRKTAVPKRISAPKKDSPRRRIPAPIKIANKTSSVTDTSSTASRSRKTHKWAGGGAERDMIATGLNSDLGRRRSRSSDNVEHESAMQTSQMTADGKKIVRSGKGWVEYEEPLEEDEGQTGDAEAWVLHDTERQR